MSQIWVGHSFLWKFNDSTKDVVRGPRLFSVDLQDVTYNDTCKIESRYINKLYVLIQLLNKKLSEQNNNLVQQYSMSENIFMMPILLLLWLVIQTQTICCK